MSVSAADGGNAGKGKWTKIKMMRSQKDLRETWEKLHVEAFCLSIVDPNLLTSFLSLARTLASNINKDSEDCLLLDRFSSNPSLEHGSEWLHTDGHAQPLHFNIHRHRSPSS